MNSNEFLCFLNSDKFEWKRTYKNLLEKVCIRIRIHLASICLRLGFHVELEAYNWIRMFTIFYPYESIQIYPNPYEFPKIVRSWIDL